MNVKWMRMAVPLVLMACFVMTAGAALTSLPTSSFRSGTSYQQVCRVEFAVYDTKANPNEFIGTDGFTNPGTGQYIYAYQIFSHVNSIPYFVIQGLGANAVTNNNDIARYNDSGATALMRLRPG